MAETTANSRPQAHPPLSVVVPTHNSRDITLACLASLTAAHPPGPAGVEALEIVVVDDGSSDGTAEAVRREHPAVHQLRHESARGFSAAANRGLEAATGDVLWLLNSDTEVAPRALVALLEAFDDLPSHGVLGAQLSYPDGSPQWSGGAEPDLLWLFALASGLPGILARLPGYRRARPLATTQPRPVDWVTGASLAMRRPVWEDCGPLDEGYRFYGQDLDFCLSARRAGWRVAVVPAVRVMHHHGATIARHPGAEGGPRSGNPSGYQQPALLWTDLLRWAGKHHGPAWARKARGVLALGGRSRLLGRWLSTPAVALTRDADGRRAWRRDTAAYRDAVRALRARSTAQGSER